MTKTNESFMLERLVFFSDAVFAIIMTLLVIEIKLPELESATLSDQLLGEELIHLTPKFIGLFVSFFVIGMYWVIHHKLFSFVTHYHKKLLWRNLLFLLPLVIMPFSTAFLSEYLRPGLKLPLAVYSFNILFTGLMSYRLWHFATSKKSNLSTISQNEPVKLYYRVRALVIPICFVLVLLLSFINDYIPLIILPFMPVISYLIRRYFSKKHPELKEKYF